MFAVHSTQLPPGHDDRAKWRSVERKKRERHRKMLFFDHKTSLKMRAAFSHLYNQQNRGKERGKRCQQQQHWTTQASPELEPANHDNNFEIEYNNK